VTVAQSQVTGLVTDLAAKITVAHLWSEWNLPMVPVGKYFSPRMQASSTAIGTPSIRRRRRKWTWGLFSSSVTDSFSVTDFGSPSTSVVARMRVEGSCPFRRTSEVKLWNPEIPLTRGMVGNDPRPCAE
jgi:hypothetical protein